MSLTNESTPVKLKDLGQSHLLDMDKEDQFLLRGIAIFLEIEIQEPSLIPIVLVKPMQKNETKEADRTGRT